MFNQLLLKDLLVEYKKNFIPKHWAEEKYKWEAVKWFQDNWDVNVKDFPEMLNRALDKTYNLLASPYRRPKEMIVDLAKTAPEEVRSMFIDLFNEDSSIFERIKTFKNRSDTLLQNYGGGARGHYQNENYISTYLWLRYPDKYYIYKYGEVKRIAEALESDYSFKTGAYADNLQNHLRLYDEINSALKKDTELVDLFRSQLTETCYPDPELKTLAGDVCFYISKNYPQTEMEAKDAVASAASNEDDKAVHYWIYSVATTPENWEKQQYNTGKPSVIFWNSISDLKYVGNANNMKPGDIVFAAVKARNQILGRGVVLSDDTDLSDIGAYYYDSSFRQANGWAPLPESIDYKRIIKWTHKGDCPCPCKRSFPAREKLIDITSDKDYVEELNAQFKEREKGNNKKESETAEGENAEAVHYWIYSPGRNAEFWDEFYHSGIMGIGWDAIGDLKAFASKDDMKKKMKETFSYDTGDPDNSYRNAGLAVWQFANEMKPGDIVFAKKGLHHICGRGIVTSDYEYDANRTPYKNIRKVKWTHRGDWPYTDRLHTKTLSDVTAYTDSYVKNLNALFENETIENTKEREIESQTCYAYDKEKFLEEVYMDEMSYNSLVSLVQNKKNVILQGAPGVGKTFAAKRLAYSMIGAKDITRVKMVQFHQSYSYEDFIMGYRPSENGFELRCGAFYDFCKDAENDSENDYFFIIDEINRGNISKILGELLMLIEKDKRGDQLQLLYSDETFSVPKNLYIIGMMNTADRSLAMLDYALRRRFVFYEMKPAFETEGFRKYQKGLASDKFDSLIKCVKDLNDAIKNDETLGEGFCIGHSYLCNLEDATDTALSAIMEFELIPLIKEYWFDEHEKVEDWAGKLRSSIK